MDDKYYRDLIDKVISANRLYYEILYNENDMRNPIGDGFEDFVKLWNIITDQDLNVSDETYFSAVYICLATFYGQRQDPLPIWNNIVERYQMVKQDPELTESFNKAFLKFLNNGSDRLIPTMDLVYELMHLAIETKSLDIACELLWLAPTEIESWEQIEEIYENAPEWAAYLECLSDITFERLPKDTVFKETVKNLYLAFGNMPNMDKLNNLYNHYQ
ncbi:MAG: hypothetical protein K2L17_07560 [Muribaculaceae bacterium]|nr:hypothetical protein [Muribaculaceae bacterium]